MQSLRRDCLDRLLEANKGHFQGKILDLGGKKEGKRGNFDISKYSKDVTYLNTDISTNPDIHASADKIPVEDSYYDCVIATELLEYILEPKKVIEEVYRVTKNNGLVFISVPLLHPIHGDFEFDRLRFTESYLMNLFKEAGFEDQEIHIMGSVGSVIFDILKVSFGYARSSRIAGLALYFLYLFKPFFKLLDRMFSKQNRFINTGYFAILKK